jgi:hypothetical protein
MTTEKKFDQQITENSDASVPEVAESSGLSRRKFTRNVLVGSAVLLTLSNRSAWGDSVQYCVSPTLLESYRIANPSRLTETELNKIYDYEAHLHEARNGTYLNAEGERCYDINTPHQDSEKTETKLWFY